MLLQLYHTPLVLGLHIALSYLDYDVLCMLVYFQKVKEVLSECQSSLFSNYHTKKGTRVKIMKMGQQKWSYIKKKTISAQYFFFFQIDG